MTNDNTPTDPNERTSELPGFEVRLRSTFDAEHLALEARRPEHGDLPVSPSPDSRRQPWWIPAIVIGAVVVAALIVANIAIFNPSSTDEIIVGAPAPGSTPTPAPSPTETALGKGTLPPPPPSAAPAPAPAPAPFGADCSVEQAPGQGIRVEVVNIPANDPDGGLVLHSMPGIDQPEMGVLPPGPTLASYTALGCAVIADGAVWWELIGPNGPVWANAAYLRTVAEAGGSPTTVPVAFLRGAGDPQDAYPTETVPRVTERTDIEKFAVEQWLAGPTEQERSQGFSLPLTVVNADDCGADLFTFTLEAGVATVQLCGDAPSAGIGQDAGVLSSFAATMLPFPSVNLAALLDRHGRCVGDLNTGLGCLQPEVNGCGQGELVDGQVVVTPGGADSSSVSDQVWEINHGFSFDCTTVIIQLASTSGDGRTDLADHVPGGIEISHDAGVTRVELPESFVLAEATVAMAETWGPSVDTSVSGAAVLVDAPVGERDYIWISTGSEATPWVSVLSDPARIVIGICCNPTLDTFTAIGFEAGRAYGATGYFVFPPEHVAESGVRFEGFGTAFEAVGGAFVVDAAGEMVPGAEYTSPTKLDDRPPSEGSFLVGNPGVSWRPFSVTVSGLEPGDYRLLFITCDQCDVTDLGPGVEFSVP